jgi:hypothetical protein
MRTLSLKGLNIFCLITALILAGCTGGGANPSAQSSAAVSRPDPEPTRTCEEVEQSLDLEFDLATRTASLPPLASGITVLDAGMLESLDLPTGTRSGTATTLVFAVVRSGNLESSVEVHYSTRPGTATEYADYEPVSGYVAFAPSQFVTYIHVPVNNDWDPECPESFHVVLEAAHPNAVILRERATGTILDDDHGRSQFRPMPDAEVALPDSDYCEPLAEPRTDDINACSAISCVTGKPIYWTYCPVGQPLHALLDSQAAN